MVVCRNFCDIMIEYFVVCPSLMCSGVLYDSGTWCFIAGVDIDAASWNNFAIYSIVS
jgi:hypothetical protein